MYAFKFLIESNFFADHTKPDKPKICILQPSEIMRKMAEAPNEQMQPLPFRISSPVSGPACQNIVSHLLHMSRTPTPPTTLLVVGGGSDVSGSCGSATSTSAAHPLSRRGKLYRCNFCQVNFAKNVDLRRHSQVCTSKKNYFMSKGWGKPL